MLASLGDHFEREREYVCVCVCVCARACMARMKEGKKEKKMESVHKFKYFCKIPNNLSFLCDIA